MPDVLSQDNHRNLTIRQVLLIADVLVARDQYLVSRLFGAGNQLAVGYLTPSLFFGGLHLTVGKVPLQGVRNVFIP